MVDSSSNSFLQGTTRDRGTECVAQFLVLSGPNFAAKVLPFFTESEVTEIIKHVVQIRNLSKRQAFRILEEFGYLVQTYDLFAPGGSKTARQMLGASFNEEKIATLFSLAIDACHNNPTNAEVTWISQQLRIQEPSESVSSIVFLPPRLTALALSNLPTEKCLDIICCVSMFESDVKDTRCSRTDTFEIVCEIVSYMHLGAAQEMLNNLEQHSQPLWRKMCVNGIIFPVMMERLLLQTNVVDLKTILSKRSDHQITCALAGASDLVANRLQWCLPRVRYTALQPTTEDYTNTLLAERLGSLQALVEEVVLLQTDRTYGEKEIGR